jgi:chlorosome envelope protein D
MVCIVQTTTPGTQDHFRSISLHSHKSQEDVTMATEGQSIDTGKAISGAIESMGSIMVSQVKVADQSIQAIMPTIENVSKNLGSTLETGVKTLNSTVASLSEPAANLVRTCGDVAAAGIKAVSGIAWQGAEIIGSVGNSALSVIQSGISTAGNIVSGILPGKKI